ncbi:MAG: SecA [Actinoallomurus sp.]|nr:SecA [Actinoallomurus sp.]
MSIRERVRRFLGRPGTIDLRPYERLLPAISAHESRVGTLTDEELTAAARAAPDDAEFCALAREAARRALGERPYDVQLLGTLVLLSGNVAEMATGEGKTLAGALAAAGYALRGHRVHVLSVNDYLARRDAEWMRPVYDLLGVTTDWVGQHSTAVERRRAYGRQVTYAPVSEVGFDVLRDRRVTDAAELIVPDPDVALVDEADSVLVDEARVPLVLAGATEAAGADRRMADVVRTLRRRTHYEVGGDGRSVHLTNAGVEVAEQTLGGIDLYTGEQLETLTRLNVALYAHALLHRDVDYLVADGRVHLIDEARGRVARLQRWPDGLMAAVEAKEGLAASESGEILDSITVQALLRRYPVVCGMTGTAVAVGEQLQEFYDLAIAMIPPNRPCVRDDEPDRLFDTVREKERALVDQIVATHRTGRPILVGTLDVAESERLARRLARTEVDCVVLNAKNDAEEAAIVARAGERGAVTVSTQMAGRGTDIRLGEGVAGLGGLYVLSTGRHESSRLDDQLRGRSGRQGDPGGSVFFASTQDELVQRYAPGVTGGADWVVGHAQRVAEGVTLDIHRNTWRYNELVEHQRELVLGHRDRALRTDAAARALSGCRPELDEQTLASAARLVTVYHLDRAWADHMAFLADLREGIHLRALGHGLNAFDEFNREAVRAYRRLLDEVTERSRESMETVKISEDGPDLDAAGLTRPTATWTYLVQENPFGTDFERALQRVGRLFSRR